MGPARPGPASAAPSDTSIYQKEGKAGVCGDDRQSQGGYTHYAYPWGPTSLVGNLSPSSRSPSYVPWRACSHLPEAGAIHLLLIAARSEAINRLSNYPELLTLKSLILWCGCFDLIFQSIRACIYRTGQTRSGRYYFNVLKIYFHSKQEQNPQILTFHTKAESENIISSDGGKRFA